MSTRSPPPFDAILRFAGAVGAGSGGGGMNILGKTSEHGIGVLRKAGFRTAALHNPRSLPATRKIAAKRGGDRVLILEATT